METSSRLPGASRDETVIEGQKRALELAVHGAPLHDVLDVLVETVEAQSSSDVACSVLLVSDDGKHLLHGAAPHLPKAYCDAIHGISIGPTVGSCGTAAFTGKVVVVTDIQTDPLWAEFKGLAGEHGLRACWSMPIHSSSGAVLGTFAIYHHVVATPSERDRQIVELLGNTAAVVIERDTNARRLRAHQEQELQRLRGVIDGLPNLAWTATADGNADFYNRRWYEYTGVSAGEAKELSWEKLLEPDAAPRIIERWRQSIARGEAFEMEYRIRGGDGRLRWFLTRMRPERDAAGTIVRWFGASTDVDAIKVSLALADEMKEQSLQTQRALLELRAAKEDAERRVADLESGPRRQGS